MGGNFKIFIKKSVAHEFEASIWLMNTRNSTTGKLTMPSHNTAKFERSCLHRSIKSWNGVPQDIPKDNIRIHKNQLQKTHKGNIWEQTKSSK